MLMNSVLVTGVERLSDGDLKVYVGPRWKNIYVLLRPGKDANEVERAWANQSQHVFIPKPPSDALMVEKTPIGGKTGKICKG